MPAAEVTPQHFPPQPGRDRLLGVLMTDGFSATLVTPAFAASDAYVYGFALTETSLPFEPGPGTTVADASPIHTSG